MAADTRHWRRLAAIGVLSLAALGVAGCDDREGAGDDQQVEQGGPAGDETASVDDDATIEGESPTEGEMPYEDDGEG